MSGIEQLKSGIEFLEKQGASDETFRLLAAIAACPFLDEALDKEFRTLGYKAAIECFQNSNMYWMGEPEQVSEDPDNPANWEGYQEFCNTVNSATKE